jgi:hypothetical protein
MPAAMPAGQHQHQGRGFFGAMVQHIRTAFEKKCGQFPLQEMEIYHSKSDSVALPILLSKARVPDNPLIPNVSFLLRTYRRNVTVC